MSSLTPIEKMELEELFYMRGGYVLEFTDSTFAEFFYDIVKIAIEDEKYYLYGGSKAKRLRAFWQIENDYSVGKVIQAMIEVAEKLMVNKGTKQTQEEQKLIEDCKAIANRLLSGEVNLNHLKNTAFIFDAKYLKEQIDRMEKSVNEDPALAIGTAKDLIETCCKTILSERGKPVTDAPNIPTLTKMTLKELNLLPDDIHEKSSGSDIIKRLLSNLATIGNNLAKLRALYGTGHGKDGRSSGLSARHAKLAVGSAATLATFLFDTHKERKASTGERKILQS